VEAREDRFERERLGSEEGGEAIAYLEDNCNANT